ncbi:MaoC family dehydratase [Actinophytocola sediminis]
MTHYARLAELVEDVGAQLGVSDWVTIEQDMIDGFADLTNDHQWVHVDRERAAAGPFGTTVAHGYLTLSLTADLVDQVLTVDDVDVYLNKGLDRVRFKAPVRSGERVRARVEIVAATPRVHGYTEVVLGVAMEIEGGTQVAMTSHLRLLAHVPEPSPAPRPVVAAGSPP